MLFDTMQKKKRARVLAPAIACIPSPTFQYTNRFGLEEVLDFLPAYFCQRPMFSISVSIYTLVVKYHQWWWSNACFDVPWQHTVPIQPSVQL